MTINKHRLYMVNVYYSWVLSECIYIGLIMKTILLISIILLLSCKKKEQLPEYIIHYTAYAKVVPYSIKYATNDDVITEDVNTNNWSRDVTVNYINYYSIQINNKALTPNDSVSITMTCGSKSDKCSSALHNTNSNCIVSFKIIE